MGCEIRPGSRDGRGRRPSVCCYWRKESGGQPLRAGIRSSRRPIKETTPPRLHRTAATPSVLSGSFPSTNGTTAAPNVARPLTLSRNNRGGPYLWLLSQRRPQVFPPRTWPQNPTRFFQTSRKLCGGDHKPRAGKPTRAGRLFPRFFQPSRSFHPRFRRFQGGGVRRQLAAFKRTPRPLHAHFWGVFKKWLRVLPGDHPEWPRHRTGREWRTRALAAAAGSSRAMSRQRPLGSAPNTAQTFPQTGRLRTTGHNRGPDPRWSDHARGGEKDPCFSTGGPSLACRRLLTKARP